MTLASRGGTVGAENPVRLPGVRAPFGRAGVRLTTVFRAGLRAPLRYVSSLGLGPMAGPVGTWVLGAMAACAAMSAHGGLRGNVGPDWGARVSRRSDNRPPRDTRATRYRLRASSPAKWVLGAMAACAAMSAHGGLRGHVGPDWVARPSQRGDSRSQQASAGHGGYQVSTPRCQPGQMGARGHGGWANRYPAASAAFIWPL